MQRPHKRVIHLVEPDMAVRDSIKNLLESFDYKINTYSTGRSFFNNSRLKEDDCVLVENALSDMTGLDLCEKIKQSGSKATLVLLTSANDAAFEKLNQSGVAVILQKPIKSNKLIETISAI